jgi:Tfp pilus assembly protein PilF
MSRWNQRRRLSAISIAAALAALFIQSTTGFAQAVAESTAQPASAIQQPEYSAASVQPLPTPEQLGDTLMTHQRYQAAIDAYKQAPVESASAWNKMGIAYQMMFNNSDASRCYQASLKLNPKNANVLNNLGTIFDAQKQYGAAEHMYRKALKLDPQSALIHKNLGTSLLAEHRYKKGWEAYKEALALNPQIFQSTNSPRVENPASVQERGAMNYYMAKGCVRAGQKDRAIEYLRLALNEGFTNPKKIVADSEFAGLRGDPAFDQLLAAQHTP